MLYNKYSVSSGTNCDVDEDGTRQKKRVVTEQCTESQQPTSLLLERKHPLFCSRRLDPQNLTVIRPPSFSLSATISGLKILVAYRDLLYALTVFRLVVRYKQSMLGWVWAVLQPLAMILVYTLIFSRVARVSTDGVPYPLFVFSGLLPWIFFSSAISNAMNGLVAHSTLLTKLYFPREIIPLSYVFAALVDFAIASVILGGLMVYYRVPFSWNILYALPVIAILIAFTSAIALFLSSIQVRFRDVAAALPVLLQAGVFAIPVVYSVGSVPVRFQRLYLLNPVASLIGSFRSVVLHGSAPDAQAFIVAGAITICCLVLAYGFFKVTESTMVDEI